ncbi:MAG: enoyl-CoA hydratase/isomerase family protein [Bryobacteraceae bacterium]
MSTSLQISREGRVLRLTLNRPEKRNALSVELCRALVSVCDEADQDRHVGAILLDAAGGVFCAGMDLDEVLDPLAAERTAIHEQLFTLAARLTTPLVAAVQGPALGGGVGLLANAHVVLAAQGTSFGLTEIRIGMWPFVIFRAVVAAMGERRAVELSLTGRIFGLPEALQWGLVHEAAPAFELDDRATAIARHLSESSAQAITGGLEFVRECRGEDAASAGLIARRRRAAAFASDDFREGVEAFRGKRKPQWPSISGL